ncbi:WD40-repeat-containing domain protein [Chytriomyces sp. MP71]|nr:WD40-repeat-containing domain protein [Chytriomyces sp. MP71]
MAAQQFAVFHPTETSIAVVASDASGSVATFRGGGANVTTVSAPIHANACAVGKPGLLLALAAKSIVLFWAWQKESSPACKLSVPEVLSALTFSHNGHWVVGGGVSGRVYLWELSTGNMLAMFDAHFKPIKSIAFSPDDAAFVTSGDDAFAHIWLLARVTNALEPGSASESYATLTGHSLPITDVAFSATSLFNKAKVFTSSLDRSIKVWDATSGVNLATILFPRALTCLAVDPLDMIVYAGAQDGIVYTANLYKTIEDDLEDEHNVHGLSEGDMITVTDNLDRVFKGHKSAITSITLSFDGKQLMSGSSDGSAIVWDAPTRQQLRTHYLSPATAAAAAKNDTVPAVGRVCALLRPRQDLRDVTGAAATAVVGLPVWKRFPGNRVEERAVDVAVRGGGVKPVAPAVARLETWDDLDLSVPPFDEDDLANYPCGYNSFLDTPNAISERFLAFQTTQADEQQTELESLRAQLEKLNEHNRALRAINDELYAASSKNVVEFIRDRKKLRQEDEDE